MQFLCFENNNNIQDNVYGAVIMAEPLRELIYTHHRHLLLLSPKADTHFSASQRVEG